jgi:hypothetical protein
MKGLFRAALLYAFYHKQLVTWWAGFHLCARNSQDMTLLPLYGSRV